MFCYVQIRLVFYARGHYHFLIPLKLLNFSQGPVIKKEKEMEVALLSPRKKALIWEKSSLLQSSSALDDFIDKILGNSTETFCHCLLHNYF